MPSSLYKRLRDILLANGCHKLRHKASSHQQWYSPVTQKKFPVSVNIESRGLAKDILKAAGIKTRL